MMAAGVQLDFFRREGGGRAAANRIHFDVNGRAVNRIVDAVQDIHHAGDLF